MAKVVVGLELPLQITLLHVVEGDNTDVCLMAVLLLSSPHMFHHPGDLEPVGVPLTPTSKNETKHGESQLIKNYKITSSEVHLPVDEVVE